MPLLTITIPWDPNIVTIGGIVLTWHGLFTAVGILAGVQLALYIGRRIGFDEDDAYSISLVGVPGGVLGARMLYVIEHWAFFRERPLEILALNEGGISVWGAVIGGVLSGLLFAMWRRYDIRLGLDSAAFGLLVGLATGRLGDLVNGEHLATATTLPWGVVYTDRDSPAFAHSLAVGPHHPATTYELLGMLLLLGLMFLLLERLRSWPGLVFFVFLDIYAALRFVVSFLRVDSAGAAFGLDVPQMISVLAVVASIPAIWWLWKHPRESQPAHPSSPSAARIRVATPARPTRGRRGGDL